MVLSYSEVVDKLLDAVPEFENTDKDWNRDLPSDVLGSFALYLRDRTGTDSQSLRKSWNFLELMAAAEDNDVVDLLVVSVLEVLADEEDTAQWARDNMGTLTSVLFGRVLNGWVGEVKSKL